MIIELARTCDEWRKFLEIDARGKMVRGWKEAVLGPFQPASPPTAPIGQPVGVFPRLSL